MAAAQAAAAARGGPPRRAASRPQAGQPRRRAGRRPKTEAARQRRRGAGGDRCWAPPAIFGPPEFLQHLTVFLLACFVGWQVIWNVTPALHTPLMSVTNAISGIIVIGGMLALVRRRRPAALALGGVAVLVAAINIAGGFLVTQRMLQMFRK